MTFVAAQKGSIFVAFGGQKIALERSRVRIREDQEYSLFPLFYAFRLL